MLSRLMDLVVLVAELTQDSDKAYKNLDQELMMRGYSAEEIEQAVFLYSSRGEGEDREKPELHNKSSVRVLSEWERLSLSSECYGYLLRLLNLGIVNGGQILSVGWLTWNSITPCLTAAQVHSRASPRLGRPVSGSRT